jgi:hypothetical protein
MLSGASSSNGAPQSLEQLLERQWEQGSQFLMEQAQHFDSKKRHNIFMALLNDSLLQLLRYFRAYINSKLKTHDWKTILTDWCQDEIIYLP